MYMPVPLPPTSIVLIGAREGGQVAWARSLSLLHFSVYRVEFHHPLHRTSNVASYTLHFLHADPHDAIDEESTLHTAT